MSQDVSEIQGVKEVKEVKTEVEHLRYGGSVLHFSGGQAWECWCVCLRIPARVWTLDPENRCKDFDETWYEVKG